MNAPALVAAGAALSFGELARAAARRAASLPPLGRGAPFALEPRISVDDVAALHAAALSRAPIALLPAGLPPVERAALLAELPARVPDPVAAILYTSGSTGRRKAVLLDRGAFVASAAASAAVLGWRDDDRWLVCLPLSHIGGLSVLTRCLWARRTAVLADPSDRFDGGAIAGQIARDRVTLVSLVPTMLARLLDADLAWRPPPHLRAVVLGGAPPPPALLVRAAERGLIVRTTYGMTETCSHVAIDGRALPGVDLAVRDGRIAVRGPMLLRGYATPDGDPAVDADGWFLTADRGLLEPDGRLRVLGRADAAILSGGETVDPHSVEAALIEIPGVDAACVFGVPDAEWGERVCAAVVAASPPSLTPQDIARALRGRLAPHERPRLLAFLPELPMSPGGKVDRAATARRAAAYLAPLCG